MRIEADVLERLDELTHEMDRSRSYLIAQAVREFLERSTLVCPPSAMESVR